MAKRRSYYDNYWPRYEWTRPIDVEDGIKAKSKRGRLLTGPVLYGVNLLFNLSNKLFCHLLYIRQQNCRFDS